MLTFQEFLQEAVVDVGAASKKRAVDRTDREQRVLDAMKTNKPKQNKVVVHLKHEDGSKSKETFKLMKSPEFHDTEAADIAQKHLKNAQAFFDDIGHKLGHSRAKEILKVDIK